MRAGVDIVPLLIFIGIAIISSLFKKKAKAEEEEDSRPTPTPARGPMDQRAKRRTWEEEIRALLENKTPPPVIRETQPPRMPQPARSPARPMAKPAPPVRRPARPSMPVPSGELETSVPVPQSVTQPRFEALPGLSVSGQQYAHAATLQERVTQHMNIVTHTPVSLTSVEHKQSAAAQEARALVKDTERLRALMLTSVILGAPRGLEPYRAPGSN